jgi:lipopolysaccharide export system protein LptA
MIRSVLLKIGGFIMKKNLSLLATLALAAALSPAAFAQQDQPARPSTSDPQTQTAPAPDTSSADTQAPKSFSGTVVKMQKQYVLKTDTATYQLDDQTKAKQFNGKQVTVSGILDQSTSMIRVSDIQPAS